jgi:hypothetical protein
MWQFDDDRDSLFPDLHASGVLTRHLAAEKGIKQFERPENPCGKCGGTLFWRYPIRGTQDLRDKQTCVACKLEEPKRNKDAANARKAKHRAAKKNATPIWLTKEHNQQIKNIYQRASELTEQTGESHHVDHIIPLTHDLVCGLHVPWNLRPTLGSENSSKCNNFNPHNDWQTGRKDLLTKYGTYFPNPNYWGNKQNNG